MVICVCEKAVVWEQMFWACVEKRSFEREFEALERVVEIAEVWWFWAGAIGGRERACFLCEGAERILLEGKLEQVPYLLGRG